MSDERAARRHGARRARGANVATATAERRTVTALDAATGEELFVRTLTPKTGPGPVGLAPVEGGLVVSVQDRARTRVERLG